MGADESDVGEDESVQGVDKWGVGADASSVGVDVSGVGVDEWDVVGDESGAGADVGTGESDVDMCEVDVVRVKC